MTPDAQISFSFIFSAIAALGVILTAYFNFRKSHSEDVDQKIEIAKEFAKLNVKLDSFADTMNDMGRKSEKSMDKIETLSIAINTCNERIEALFRYKDDHEKRITDLEDKM